MTNEELDVARAREALSKCQHGLSWDNLTQASRDTLTLAARYGREGWTPTDPDLVLAREVAANRFPPKDMWSIAVRRGIQDDDPYVQIALAAIRATRGGQS